MKTVNYFFLGLLVFGAISGANATTIYVNGSAPAGGDGSSWSAAVNTIEAGLSAAASASAAAPGTVVDVWIAGGTYPMTYCNHSLPNKVNIYGGFAGTETQASQRGFTGNLPTIQSLITEPAGVGCYLFNLTGTTNRFDGVTLAATGGILQAGGSLTAVSDTFAPTTSGATAVGGGGINVCNGGTLVVDKSLFQNLVAGVGGGVAGLNAASVTITNSTFSGNQAQDTTYWNPSTNKVDELSGGAAINIDGNFFYYYYNYGPPVNNTRVTLSSNTFYGNTETGTNGGGAIHVGNADTVSITNSTFGASGSPNTSNYGGGAVSVNAVNSASISGNNFSGNNAYFGGAIYSTLEKPNAILSITSNTFTQNSGVLGGAISDRNEANGGTKTVTLNITSNAFSQNTVTSSGSGPAIYYDGTEAKIDNKATTAAIDSALVNSNSNLRRADISP